MRKATLRALGFSILILAGFSPLAAQVDTGTISGIVRDPSGGVVPQAKVTIRNIGTGQVQNIAGDAQGLYVSLPLYTGQYSVTVEVAGFDKFTKRVDLNVAQRVSLDFDLQVASAAQAVDVQATAGALQAESETSTLSNLRNETEVRNLPLNGRNFAQLMGLAAGVMPAESEMTGNNPIIVKRGVTAYAMNGSRLEENQFLIEGIYDNDNHNGLGILLFPPLDAIDEFRVETSVADARFGRSGGGTTNIIYKSGTNRYHGDLFEFFRNSALDARNFFDKRIPEFRMNQYGATLGGPLVPGKDTRTFFFADFQGTRTRQGQSLVDSVPTAAERTGDFSVFPQVIYNPLTQTASGSTFQRQPFAGNQIPASMIDPVGRNLANLYPLPNSPGTVNNYLYAAARAITENTFDMKVNHSFSDSDSGWARYSHSFFNIYEPGQLPPPAVGGGPPSGPNYQTADQAVLSETHIFSPRAVNQARFGFTRLNDQSLNIDYGQNAALEAGIAGVNVPGNINSTGLPLINITGLTPLGENGFSPAIIISNNFQWNDDVTYIRGRHALSFGGQFLRIQYNVFQSTSERGSMSFTTAYTSNPASTGASGLGAADLLLGKPLSGSLIYVPGLIGMRQSDVAGYIQDDFKATSRLTINLGLRYDNFIGWPYEEVNNRMYQFVPATGNLVQVGANGIPRSGHFGNNFNFAPRIGLAYKLPHDTVIRSAYGMFYSAPQVASTYDINFNPPETISSAFTNSQFDFPNARTAAAGFDRSNTIASGASLVYLDPHAKTPMTQQWNLTVAHQFPASLLLTAAYVGTKGTWLNGYPDINEAVPGLTPIASRRPFPAYNTISGLENVENSSYNGLQLTLARRLTKGLDFQLAYTYSHAIDETSGNIATTMDSYHIRLDRGSADFNVPHRFVASWTYLLPFQATGVLKQVVQGWQLNGILSLYSGLPFSVGSASNTLNNGKSTRADRLCNGSLSNPTVADWFNLSCFAIPGTLLWGDGGRNILHGPDTRVFDFSVFKDFPLSSDTSRYLQFRSEFFNLLNIPQFNNPAATFGAPGDGTVTSSGSPRTLQRISREIQFSLKLYF